MADFQCPSCGAAVTVKNAASLYVVCSYCSTTSVRKDMNLDEIGKAAVLKEDGTPIMLQTQGRYNGKNFEVIGRIQLQFDAGFWNEWHLDYGGKSAWLGETNGIYVFTEKTELDEKLKTLKYEDFFLGRPCHIKGNTFFAKDIQDGICVSGEGELPFPFQNAYRAPVIDLVDRNNKFATLDFSEEEPILFMGDFCEFKDLSLKNLRDIYEWEKPRVKQSEPIK